MLAKHCQTLAEAERCHIVYISPSEARRLAQIVSRDVPGAMHDGVAGVLGGEQWRGMRDRLRKIDDGRA